MTREEKIEALKNIGVGVPESWPDEKVDQIYEELKDVQASGLEVEDDYQPASPRG